MNGKWVFEKDFDAVAARVAQFECVRISLVILPLAIQPDEIIFGCYVPTIPRPTSLIAGKIIVRRLGNKRAEVQAFDFQDWAEPFVSGLIGMIEGE